jgi:putative nucleotidyltransferase with HDIG domain
MKQWKFSLRIKLTLLLIILIILIVTFLSLFGISLENIFISGITGIIISAIFSNLFSKSFEEQLLKKDKEIMGQRDEISALYQQAVAMNEELYSLLDEIKTNYLSTVRALANSIEASDKYTKGHCERVTGYALKIAEAMNFSVDDMMKLEFAGLLHDIGKIGIPSGVLNKTSSLTDEEYMLIKNHPKIGYDILKDIDFLKDSTNIMLEHHERMDGRGYPLGKNGDNLSKLSKILAVADSYDAMTSSRPYRRTPLTVEEAVEQLVANKDKQFDSEVVDVFVVLLRQNLFSSLEEAVYEQSTTY